MTRKFKKCKYCNIVKWDIFGEFQTLCFKKLLSKKEVNFLLKYETTVQSINLPNVTSRTTRLERAKAGKFNRVT